MMVIFEVFLAPGTTSFTLSEEMLRETQAQIMTLAEARAVGFDGLPDPPAGKEVRLIAVARRDAAWVQQALEGEPRAASFRVHEVG
jgi:hypothetical protein